jgi:diaminohydroxyphosphoribosylaminopyrimidine deaminase/5-amino-6-(5-phosphoribosylamino)uracil reductase
MTDEQYIKRTFRLALRAEGKTSPNPMVGAILVKDGEMLAEDFHRQAGTPHAEALAIAKAGDHVRGATLYVNLEPCCHTAKRTPPCTNAIIRAGIRKVIIAMKDPNPKVSGMGIAELERSGLEVRSGILQDEAKRLNEAYIKHITTGRPFVILKIAMTLDGKIATPEGESKWITGDKARRRVHRLRSSVDAVLTAIGTVKADNPELTARFRGSKNPLRVVIDPNLEIDADAKILRMPPQTTIVTRNALSDPTSVKGGEGGLPMSSQDQKIIRLKQSGVQFIFYEDTLDLKWLMEKLVEQHIISVLIEGGSSLNAHALEDGIVDKVMIFIAPKMIGGKNSYPAVGGKTFKKLEEAYRLRDMSISKIGDDLLIEGYMQQSHFAETYKK